MIRPRASCYVKEDVVMLEEKKYFIHGKDDSDGTPAIAGRGKRIPERAAEAIFDDMVSFAEYALCGSLCCYLMRPLTSAHYPVEFMAALTCPGM